MWSLPNLLASVASQVEQTLSDARSLIAHEGEKGGASEEVWRTLLRRHLPLRYQVDTGFVVDSNGEFSEQIDVIVYDRQYSPLVFELGNRRIFPAESIYAVFEAKQSANSKNITAAKRKAGTVRKLKRTNLPIRHLDGSLIEKGLPPILGGLLALESDWSPPFGDSMAKSLQPNNINETLDTGCIASHGVIRLVGECVKAVDCKHAATVFVLDLVARLQQVGTVPMLDMGAYARHLD